MTPAIRPAGDADRCTRNDPKFHGLLAAILQNAVEADPPLRTSNPATGVRLPRLDDGAGDDAIVVLTREEFQLLRSCAKSLDRRVHRHRR